MGISTGVLSSQSNRDDELNKRGSKKQADLLSCLLGIQKIDHKQNLFQPQVYRPAGEV